MRPLNDYFIPAGNVDLGGAADTSNIVSCPEGGRLIGVSYTTQEAIDVAGTCDVNVTGVDSTVDVSFPITAVDKGGFAYCDADLFLADFDSLEFASNDEPGTGIVDITAVIRR